MARRDKKSAVAAAAKILGARGGKKGGPARDKALTGGEKSAIAKKGAEARWGKSGK